MTKPDDDAARWEELARREPYFGLRADGGAGGVASSGVASQGFFQTGEDDIASLLAAMGTLFPGGLRMDSVLDFGCGVGRLTIPLARRAERVVACDIAPTMLAHARENAERAGLRNITFQLCDEVFGSVGAAFDFICSLLVFQYIPASAGYALIQSLATQLREEGVGAFQMRLRGSGGLRRFADFDRLRRRSAYGTAAASPARAPMALGEMHWYDERLVAQAAEVVGASIVARFPAQGGRSDDAVLVVRRNRRESA